jgi:membrane protease YdiL (CAAX protease family)
LAWFAIEAFSNTKFYGYHFHFNKNIGDWINTFLIVGFTEEILFRGFILNKLKQHTSFGKANLIQAVLFILIHVPVWISLNKQYFVIGSIWEYLWAVGFVFLFCIAMGYIVKKTNSLWPAILIHSFGDLTYVLTII